MRSNIVIGLLVCGLAASLGVILMRSTNPRTTIQDPAPAGVAEVSPTTETAPARTAVKPVVASQASTMAAADHPAEETPEEKQEAYVASRSAELMDLAMNDDADSLETILGELSNRDPQIREAAVQAAVQFHSRDAIPRLQDAALQTDDAKERASIQDAIEFLKLPSLTEVLAAQQATNPVAQPVPSPAPQQ